MGNGASRKEDRHQMEVILGQNVGWESGESQSAQTRKASRQALPGVRKSYNGYYSEYVVRKMAALMADAAACEAVRPFAGKWVVDQWRRAAAPVQLPVASVGAERQVMKYGHFLYSYDETFFYIAVPGRHTSEEWPDRGASGFFMWQPIRNSDEYGYWCLVIELKTGIITEIS